MTFKQYNTALNSDKNVVLLNPRNIKDGYFIESGFVTSDKNIDIPNSDSIWSIDGNNKLTQKTPIKIFWANKNGIKFEKTISLDDQFLFTIKQKIINPSDKKFDFYSYGQIIRNRMPDGLSNFYILHEGMLGALDGELIEEDYDDIEEEKFSKKANKGWFGIGDKYWISSIIPPRNKEFKTTFDYKKKFRANYISTQPLELSENSYIEEEMQIIIAAKELMLLMATLNN